jgi:hypothetical protein
MAGINKQAVTTEQIVDWRAAVLAGVIAGAIFLVLEMVLPTLLIGSSPWVALRYTASMMLGDGVLPPPAGFDATVVLVGLLIHFVLSILYACVLAFIIHRGGLLTGIIGGALFGLAIFAINYYTFTLFFPWFFSLRSWIAVLAHVLFGAVAGGLYESLEREQYVVVEENS